MARGVMSACVKCMHSIGKHGAQKQPWQYNKIQQAHARLRQADIPKFSHPHYKVQFILQLVRAQHHLTQLGCLLDHSAHGEGRAALGGIWCTQMLQMCAWLQLLTCCRLPPSHRRIAPAPHE
jgi:hypothetical protein